MLVDKPRVTKFQIDWDENDYPVQQMAMADDGQMVPVQKVEDGMMAKGTQGQDRMDMMNAANLAEVAQDFNQ